MIIEWTSGVGIQQQRYADMVSHVDQYNIGLVAVWSYNPVTGMLCVTVTIAGTYCYNVGVLGGGRGYKMISVTDGPKRQ